MTLSVTMARRLLVVLAAALALALAATTAPIGVPGAPTPAVAEDIIEVDIGVLETGVAQVAKAFKKCEKNSATGLVEWERKEGSPGLGLPDPEGEKKNAWWGLRTPVISTVKGIGALEACGFLTAMGVEDDNGNGVQLGAACGASKGWNGIGTIEWTGNGGEKNVPLYQDKQPPPQNPGGDGITQLRDIGWKVSVGGTLPVTANIVEPGNKANKIGFLLATVQAFGGDDCADKGPEADPKGDPKTGGEQGANEFTVNGVYEAVRHHGKEPNPTLKKEDIEPGHEKKRPHEKPPPE